MEDFNYPNIKWDSYGPWSESAGPDQKFLNTVKMLFISPWQIVVNWWCQPEHDKAKNPVL